ncbi:MAG TPA: hypothetical protein PKL08_06035 [Thermoanaerobaculaceae bacterium]|nr:hypothetical protein [Thermoanaerobaculaceae bacterium]
MSGEEPKVPDHTLLGASPADDDEAPQVYAVADLRAFVKPDLDEELGAPTGSPAVCGTEVLCTCVPVETCVCNTVSYRSGGTSCPGDCPCQCTSTCTCQCTGTCVSLYWYPY